MESTEEEGRMCDKRAKNVSFLTRHTKGLLHGNGEMSCGKRCEKLRYEGICGE